MTPDAPFGERLRLTRKHLRLTQAGMAHALTRAGLTTCAQSVSNWECGRNEPWPREAGRILAAIGKIPSTQAPARRRVSDLIG